MLRLFDFFLNRCQVDRRYLAQLNLEILDFQRLFFKTILEVKNALATLIFKFIYLQAVLFSNLGYFLLEIRYDLLFAWSLEVEVGDFTFDIRVNVVH